MQIQHQGKMTKCNLLFPTLNLPLLNLLKIDLQYSASQRSFPLLCLIVHLCVPIVRVQYECETSFLQRDQGNFGHKNKGRKQWRLVFNKSPILLYANKIIDICIQAARTMTCHAFSNKLTLVRRMCRGQRQGDQNNSNDQQFIQVTNGGHYIVTAAPRSSNLALIRQ